ncbi:MAG TPA: hypothetical protein PLC54_00625 [Spirochaetales bacterium]|nr:hypothetical protein [Spirochaetales bacterium]
MTRRYRTAGILCTTVVLCFHLAVLSCASGVHELSAVEMERLLPVDAPLYLALNAELSARLALLLGLQAEGASTLTERVSRSVLAASAVDTENPVVYGVARGSFPSAFAGALFTKKAGWTRATTGWAQTHGPMHIAFAGRQLALFANAELDGMAQAARSPGINPIPYALMDSWKADVALYLARPAEIIGSLVPVNWESLPLESIMLSASVSSSDYDAAIRFHFDSDTSANLYQSLCRLLVLGLSRFVWPDSAGTIMAHARWATADRTVSLSGMRLSANDLETLFAMLAGPFLP